MTRPKLAQRLFAGLVALMGLVNIASALLVQVDVTRKEILRDLLPLEVSHIGRWITLIAGFGLLIVAWGLWRGKRVAWRITISLLVVSAVVHFVKGLDWEEAVGALTLAVLLGTQRRFFVRRSDPPTLRRVPLFAIAGLAGIVLYGIAGFWFLPTFHPFSLSLALQEIVAQFVWDSGPYAALATHGRAEWFLDSLNLLSLSLVVWVLLMVLRPVLPSRKATADRQHAEELLQHYATSSLAPFVLDDDKLLYFGETVEGVVAYRVMNSVAVVCGDPVARPEQVGVLAAEFVDFCARQDWQVCFYEVQPRHLDNYTPLNFAQIKIGEDAWIDLPSFTLKGSAISDIRHAVNKIIRDGITFHVLDPSNAVAWQQMQAIEAGWRAAQGGIELHFSIGQLPRQPDPRATYTLALGPDGETVLGYCAFLSIGGIHGLALDVMRRAPNAFNGTMEFLIARSLEHFRDAGYQQLSLGLAPLANVDAPQNGLLERGIRAIYAHPKVNEAYHYQSLFFFKKKFNPQWRGGYLLYPGTLALPQVLAAVVRVHAPALGPRLVWAKLGEKLNGRGALASMHNRE